MPVWTVPRDWGNEPAAIIIGGGVSAADVSPERLRGRKVIVVNSSYERFPFADLLFFGDRQWWNHHRNALRSFGGEIVTTVANIGDDRVKTLNNSRPDKGMIGLKHPLPLALSRDPTSVPCRRTSMVPAMNIAVLLGARALVLLGLDGQKSADGRWSHHAPHPKEFGDPTEQKLKTQLDVDFIGFAASLAAHGITVINASPGSAVDLWPVMPLAAALARVEGSHEQAAQPGRDPTRCSATQAGPALA